MSDLLKKLLERYHVRLRFSSWTSHLHFMFCNANSIYQIEQVFAVCVRCDVSQLLVSDGSNSSSFHLGVERI